MLEHLARLAERSAELRKAALEKEAGIMDLGLRFGAKALNFAKKNPLGTIGAGMSAAMAPSALQGSYQRHKSGFDPDTQRAMLGSAPVPPRT